MKQDKKCGLAVMDRSKYTDECLDILQIEQFTLLKYDATKSTTGIKKDTTGIKKGKNKISNTRVSPVISH